MAGNNPVDEAFVLIHDNVNTVAEWCKGIIVEEINPETDERYPALNLQCGEDVKRASLGDWIVKKEDGTFDVTKQGDFLQALMHD